MFKRIYTATGSQKDKSFSTVITIQGDFNGQIFNVNENGEVPIAVNMSVLSDYSQYKGRLVCNTCQVQNFNVTSHTIVGLSLEKLEAYLYDRNPTGDNKYPGSLVGFDITNKGVAKEGEAHSTRMGGNANTSGELPITSDMIHPYDCEYTHITTGESGHGRISDGLTGSGSLIGNNQPVFNIRNQIYGDWDRKVDTTITVGIPIFDTDNHLKQYIQSGGEIVEGLLNGEETVTPDEYKYFLQNEFTVFNNYGLSNQTGTSTFFNYRFEMENPNDRMCLVNVFPDAGGAKKYVLYGARPKKVYINTSDGWKIVDDIDRVFNETYFRTEDYFATNNRNQYVKVRLWYTNLYYKDGADSRTWAKNYIETGNPAGADNLKEVQRANGQKVPGKIGEPTQTIPNGTPSFTMSSGGRILGLTSGQANKFFTDIFQAGSVQDLLDGTQLFGANQLNSIRGFHYLPVNIDEICTCSSTTKAYLGSYEYTFDSSVKWVTNNNKMVNCGSAAFNETYGDFRDYEPYCKMAVMLPFCGTHELKISKYINTTITIKYAVDVTTGACTAYLYANNVIIDSFDGSMQVNRPVTGNDQQRQASAVFEGIMKTGTAAVGTVGQVAGGVAGGAAIGGAVGNLAAQTAGSIAGGAISGGGAALGVIGQAANTLQMSIDNPISTRGSYGGILGLFGVQSPYFIFAWLRTVEPNNELAVVGKPSGTGQAVGAFGGFLQTSAFQLATGFTGTDKEAEEIYNIVTNGIYL